MLSVTIHFRDKRHPVTFNETAVFTDDEAGWLVLSLAHVSGNRTNLSGLDRKHYTLKDNAHICYDWADVERVEITDGALT